jgi:hypothetical protein
MGIFFTNRAKLQEMERELAITKRAADDRAAAHVQEMAALGEKNKKLYHDQELLVKDILSLQEVMTSYKGNDYRDYAEAVTAIAAKYTNTADWGCVQTRAIIDLRAAFILGEGLQVTHTTETRAEAEAELQFVDDFFSYNGLDHEMAQEIVKESEIEGKCAIKLFYEEDEEAFEKRPGMVSARFLSWSSKRYVVEADAEDYLWYKRIVWPATATAPAGALTEPEFVYKKFSGRINDPNDAQPRIMGCLTEIDRLDKALRDLREINHLFASPTPDFMVDDPVMADRLLSQIKDINWKIGKVIVHTGTFQLISPEVAGVANLIAEIELLVKLISGTTGIPIHYLGLLDLLKNRATGDNTRELVMAATTRERAIWEGAFGELVEKAMLMYNDVTKKTPLDPSKVSVSIPLVTQDHWDRIAAVLIPAVTAGIVSKEFVAEQIPGVDMEAEAKRAEKREAKEAERAKEDLEMMRANLATAGRGAE